MKKTIQNLLQLGLVAAVLDSRAPAQAANPQSQRVTVHPQDSGEALVNPAMGWVIFYYDNALSHYGNREEPHDTLQDFPGLSVVYLRLAWGYLEPEKGKFNWSIVDGPAQRFIDRGLQVAFRFSCYEGHSGQFDATPPWVRAAGARGDLIREDDGKEYWQPRYDNPVFLRHLEDFLAAAARRYDGNPNVAWIDVGSFGIWGEGHTRTNYARKVRRRHIELHAKHFKKTLIAVNDDLGKDRGQSARLDDLVSGPGRFTLRDDSILVNPGLRAYRSAHLADLFWRREPIILESEHYGSPRRNDSWSRGELFLEAMEAYRASYVSAHWYPREFLKENGDLIQAMNRRMGYRLNLLEASWPSQVGCSNRFELHTRWKNVGVAPCYPGGFVALTLKTGKEGIVAVFTDESWNLRELGVDLPGPASKVVQYNDGSSKESTPRSLRSLRLPIPGSAPVKELRSTFALSQVVKPGDYNVFVSVGDRDGTPRLALPLSDGDGHRRYRLGTLTIIP